MENDCYLLNNKNNDKESLYQNFRKKGLNFNWQVINYTIFKTNQQFKIPQIVYRYYIQVCDNLMIKFKKQIRNTNIRLNDYVDYVTFINLI
jgi:hypothetical protein